MSILRSNLVAYYRCRFVCKYCMPESDSACVLYSFGKFVGLWSISVQTLMNSTCTNNIFILRGNRREQSWHLLQQRKEFCVPEDFIIQKIEFKKGKLTRIHVKTHHFLQILKRSCQSLYNEFIEWFIKIFSSAWFLHEILI